MTPPPTSRPLRRAAPVALAAVALGAVTVPVAVARDGGPAARDPAEPRAATAVAASTSLPRVRVRTSRGIRDDPKVAGSITVPGSYRGRMAIELRGQSSLTFPKKSYGVELRGASGKDREAALLGMPEDGDWVLQGPWIDKSLVRNRTAYDAARAMGRWAPQTRLVELVRNGRAQGVYALTERPELGNDRVDLPGKGITGDYLLEWTFPYQAGRKGTSFGMRYSDKRVLFEDPSRGNLKASERAYVQRYVRRTERAIYGRGRGESWRRYLDEPSTVDYVLLQELFRNVDAFHASTFLQKGAGEKLRFGPAWDFDLSSGTARQQGAARSTGWWTTNKAWSGRLWNDCAFRGNLYRRWTALQAEGFGRELLARYDADVRTLTAGPAGRNFRRWRTLDTRLWQAPEARGSYRAETRYLRTWLERRIAWMDGATDRAPRC